MEQAGDQGGQDLGDRLGLAIVEQAASVVYQASQRTLSQRAGVSEKTATAATWRLVDAGLLRVVDAPTASLARRYGIVEPACKVTPLHVPHVMEWGNFAHDAFRRVPGGLCKAGLDVWFALEELGRLTVKELAESTGRDRRTVRAKLALLEKWGMAERLESGEWVLTDDADLDAAAQELGTAGLGAKQALRHAQERALHRARLESGYRRRG